jgi:DNA-nicking Smr family endonuclease
MERLRYYLPEDPGKDSLDCHGLRVWEAELAIDKFIDSCIYSRLPACQIVYGSPGPLKKAIFRFLISDVRVLEVVERTYWDTSHTCYYVRLS